MQQCMLSLSFCRKSFSNYVQMTATSLARELIRLDLGRRVFAATLRRNQVPNSNLGSGKSERNQFVSYFVTDECLGGAGPILFELTVFPKIYHRVYRTYPLFFPFFLLLSTLLFWLVSLWLNFQHPAPFLPCTFSFAIHQFRYTYVYICTCICIYTHILYVILINMCGCSSRNGPASMPRACSVFHFFSPFYTNKIYK